MRRVKPVLLAAASGLLVSLAFPSWLTPSFRPWTGWLAWFALVPLLTALQGSRPVAAAGLGWIGGFTFFASTLYWIPEVRELGVLRHAAWLAVASGLAAYWGVWGCVVACAAPSRIIWIAPAAWAATEMARGILFTGFPWTPLGASQWACPPVFLSARWIGITGISLAIVTVNVALWALWRLKDRVLPATRLAAGWVVALLLFSFTTYRQTQAEIKESRPVTVAALQGSFTEQEKWDLPVDTLLSRFENLAFQASNLAPAVIVWPETATASVIGEEPGMVERLVRLAADTKTAHVVGALLNDVTGRLSNGAFLISGSGIEAVYVKMHLVPFGEYLPRWIKVVAPFAKKLTEGLVDLSPGSEPVLLNLSSGGRAGVAICYEAIFPAHARRLVAEGAEMFVNITNDAWYGRTAATYQHALGPIARSVECGRYTIRCANTGVSLIVDPRGRFTQTLPLFQPGVVTGEAAPLGGRTIYATWGDTAVAGYILFAAWLSFRPLTPLRGKRRNR